MNAFVFRRRNLLVLAGLAALIAAGAWLALPLWAGYQRSQARSALEGEDLESALAHIQAADAVVPDDAETQFWLARIYRRLGELDKMRSALQGAEQLGLSSDRIRRETWLAWAQLGQMARAQPHLPQLLSDPRDDGPEICRAFVNGYSLNLDLAAVSPLLDAWESDYPDDPAPHFLRGRLWYSQQQWEQAAAACRKGLALAPERFEPRLRLAQSLLKMRKPLEAEQEFRRCLRAAPENADVLVGLGTALADSSRPEEARRVLLPVIEREPAHFDARILVGQLELLAGRPAEVIRWLEPLARDWPDDLAICYLLAQAYAQLGEQSHADRYFAAVERADKAVERVDQLTRQVRREPLNAEIRHELGRLLLQYRSRDEGASWLQSVLLIDPRHQPTHAALADYHARFGRDHRAQEHRQQAGDAEGLDG